MMKGQKLTATRLRLILSVSIFAIALLAGVGFYFINQQLQTVATTVSHTVVDANASQDNVQTLQRIQAELTNYKDIITRANGIVADSQSYQYQDQIVNDLNNYASKAGINITNIDFSSNTTTGTPSPITNKVQSAVPAPSGVKSVSVAVTLNNPVGYTNFLQFVQSIENNLTKMQIQKVSLSKGASANQVASDILTIQVYTR